MTVNNIVRVFVVRHGQTDHNVQKILQGQLDTPMNSQGYAQAELLGSRFISTPINHFVTSDLCRCQETLEQITKHHTSPSIKITRNLRERNMGKVQGMYLKDAQAQYGPGFRNFGEGEESLCKRVETEFNEIINGNHQYVLICTHGGVITRFFNHLFRDLNYQLADGLTEKDLRVPFNTSVSIVDYNRQTGKGIIQSFGNTSHLGGDFKVEDQLLR
ncbi:hypothetical protein KGF56_001824 [Candida oxycetoniae]|uniref:Phosphoglycerate mutase n=1 Tax=Candida oxycetoniae TaxID=497107 RepID=A0AAI9WYJ7_9ASCO|nr:uncharacterized protein KGF56_001824 [Candida oxycetoniae]KAI3405377.2 hypothetical protein KGF56_001824 [Candida oxycetoniae]